MKVKSDYQTITKAYFNSVIHTGVAGTNQIQDVITINPDSSILEDLKSGEIHRIILQNFNPLNPEITSEPVEIFYKVHYPIFNPVLLPLFVLLSLLSVVILYDYIISNQKEFNSKLIYASYQVFKDHNSNSSLN